LFAWFGTYLFIGCCAFLEDRPRHKLWVGGKNWWGIHRVWKETLIPGSERECFGINLFPKELIKEALNH